MRIIDAKIVSSLEKIYDGDKMPQKAVGFFSMLKNEKKSFQIAVEADEAGEVSLSVASDLEKIEISTVKHMKSDFPIFKKNADNYFRFSSSGYYPDLLLPVEGAVKLEKGITVKYTADVCKLITKLSETSKLGARELRNKIRKLIEDKIVDLIIENSDASISEIKITVEENAIKLLKK